MGQDPSTIRREIEQTREEMGDTVDALGYKADVKSRAKENVQDKVGSMKEKIVGATDRVSEATPDSGEVKQQAKRAVGIAQENPLGLAVGSLAIGFLAGMLIPESRMEHEKIGPMADQVKDQVRETGQEALDRGKQVAQEAAHAAKDTAQESGQQQAQELRGSAQQSAEESARSSREQQLRTH
jgi:gas vesicle protein